MRLNFNPKVALIFVKYYDEKYPHAFERLKSYLINGKKRNITCLIVDNRNEGSSWRNLDENTFYLEGDNSDREFSGWQRGLNFLREQEIKYDVVLFVNEAFEAIGPSYLKDNNINWLIRKTYFLNAAIGFVDTRWERTRLHNKGTRIWVNTNCFFIPTSLLNKLQSLVMVDEKMLDDYLPLQFPGLDSPFAKTAPMNDVYKRNIITWLTEEWHGRIELSEQTWPLFRSKVKAMLNEVMLSVRIRELGHMILPYSIPRFAFKKIRGVFRKMRKIVSRRYQRSLRDTVFTGQ
ncbi:MAG TPA: hypothetical protein VIS48_09255 [Candidatus Kryptonia bacterium]